MQYTIRSIPPKLDQALRTRARKSGKSLNEVVIETLNQATGANSKPAVYHDLDWFIGAVSIDQKEFNKSMDWLNSLPSDMDS